MALLGRGKDEDVQLMEDDLKDKRDAELKAIYLMYREGDDAYSYMQIYEEFKRRDENKLWGKNP